MNLKSINRYAKALALALVALAVAAAPSFAQTNLVVLKAQATMPDATVIDMWGFFLDTGQDCTDIPTWGVGPTISTTAPGMLTVNLRNCLDVDVSLFIPGLPKPVAPVVGTDLEGRERLVSFDAVAGANGGSTPYTWTLKPGTYLYQSGADVRTQVPMGLYGALVVDSGPSEAYPGVTYNQDEVVLFSEVDPNLNADPAGFGGARITTWNPQYFLINGKAFPDTSDLVVSVGDDVLLRFINASLETHAPTLEGGVYMNLEAEDGNPYPHPLSQYGLELPAAKTIDAIVNIGSAGSYALYDRALHLTGGGMLTYIQAGTVAGAPTAVDDSYTVAEDGTLTTSAGDFTFPGVLDNDTVGTGPGPFEAFLVSDVSSGALSLNLDGSFTYTPNADFTGTDIFTYVANDGGPDSNVATVTINVTAGNDQPVAVADAYDAVEGQMLSVPAPGVLANDTDADGDSLTAVPDGPPPLGVLVLNTDGSFDYTPAGIAGAVETFQYVANDGTIDSDPATVTITVVGAPDNIAPFANDDFAEAQRNSAGVTFSVTANDVDPDPDGAIDVATVLITTGASTQRDGTVTANADGTVTYVPKRGFRGTDTFQYTVNDDSGATSNTATVRINVVR